MTPFALLLPIALSAWLLSDCCYACTDKAAFFDKTVVAKAPDFSEFEAGQARKDQFVNYMLPVIHLENGRIRAQRERLLCLLRKQSVDDEERQWLQDMSKRHRVDDFDVEQRSTWGPLLHRMGTIPPSLALAQSANESAWGTSRFAKQGKNFFGLWCFTEGCGLVPKARKAGADHEVARFDSVRLSVREYMRTLNSHPGYELLRDLRNRLAPHATGMGLADGLETYSERGFEYIGDLKDMIEFNKWAGYDEFSDRAV